MNNVSSSVGPILIVDDNRDIHADFRKVLCTANKDEALLDELDASVFGGELPQAKADYVLDSAFQGAEAVELARRALAAGTPYALAFIDMRMPPGWDGLRTMQELKKVDPNLQFVVCSAYSDYTQDQVCERLEIRDGILFIRKPFDPADVRQIAAKLAVPRSAAA